MAASKRQGARSTMAEQSPTRALVFLRTAVIDAQIAAALASVGFGERDVDEGWRLLRAACSVPRPGSVDRDASAYEEVERLAKTLLVRARLAVRRFDPDEAQRLVGTLPPARGMAIVALRLFVDRWKAIERDAARGKKSARALVDALARRGLSTETRKHAEKLVARAMAPASGKAPPPDTSDAERAALDDLHAWVQEWSVLARQAITRRDWLIRLGIGKRRHI